MSILGSVLKGLWGRNKQAPTMQRVLNVGGNDKRIPIPGYYSDWDHVLLDIDRRVKPDVLCDARNLGSLPGAVYDAVYCSHNLEHYYRHDCPKVLTGFMHVLKADGFAEIHVPDLQAVMRRLVQSEMDIEDVLYVSPSGPITARDVFYGYGKAIEASGQDYFAHKTGFTAKSLLHTLKEAGFVDVFVSVAVDVFDLRAYAFKRPVTAQQRQLLDLSGEPN